MFLERLGPASWPLIGVLGLFLAVALVRIPALLPLWLHVVLLTAFAGALAAAAWWIRRVLRWPTLEEAKRRLELDSKMPHRPLTAWDDRLMAGGEDADSVALWRQYRRSLPAKIGALRPGAPRATMAEADPIALRALVLLLVVVALGVGGADFSGRLADALTPRVATASAERPLAIDVWLNPPAYTGLPPVFLDPAAAEAPPLTVPVGSTVLAQVQGVSETPSLRVSGRATAFEPVAQGAFRASAVVALAPASGGSGTGAGEEGANEESAGGAETADQIAVLRGGDSLASWPIAVLPDERPEVVFLAPPSGTERFVLRLSYAASDDYGVDSVTALVRRIGDPEAEPLELPLPPPRGEAGDLGNASYHDLTPHPWAGLAVEIQLVAADAIDQEGRSDPVRAVLPERIFKHPVARALVELRRRLTTDPENRFPVVRALGDIHDRPSRFFHDLVAALAIRSAERRLIHDKRPEAIAQVQALLWDTALRIEDGDLSIAARDLRDIQGALMKALAEGAGDEEIERLLRALEEALGRYLEALAEQMRDRLSRGAEPRLPPPDARTLESRELRDLIDRARELTESGARDAARELLARLQEMLENLRAGPFAEMMDRRSRDAWDMMNDLNEMRERQRDLLDRGHRRSRQDRQGEQRQGQQGEQRRGGESQSDSRMQEALRRELGEMMRRLGDALGDIPRPFGNAERSMRAARDALERNRPGEALVPQTRALDQLGQGMEAMAERFMRRMGENPGRGQGTVGMRPGQGRDPLGREMGTSGLEALEGVRIPDRMEMRRSREILRELRRRSGERGRPPSELDYIDRLLRRF